MYCKLKFPFLAFFWISVSFNYFRHYCQSSRYWCPRFSKMTDQFFTSYFAYLESIQKSSVSVLLGVYFLSLNQIWLFDFGRVHWQNGDVRKSLEKFLFVSTRLCHYFRWQVFSVDVSSILFNPCNRKIQNWAIGNSSSSFLIRYPCEISGPKKGVSFVQKSINNCVYRRHCGYERSTSLYVVFDIFLPIYTLFFLNLIFMVRKSGFSGFCK